MASSNVLPFVRATRQRASLPRNQAEVAEIATACRERLLSTNIENMSREALVDLLLTVSLDIDDIVFNITGD